MSRTDQDFSQFSMHDLFRMEVETQSVILTDGLLGLEQDADAGQHLSMLMRAAHSLKGAARIVGRSAAVRVAHAMEDCFVAAQKENGRLSAGLVDTLLAGVDLISRIAQVPEESIESWEKGQQDEIETFLTSLVSLAASVSLAVQTPVPYNAVLRGPQSPQPAVKENTIIADRHLRVTADNLNRLLGLSGEALMSSRWLDSFVSELLRLKRHHRQLSLALEGLREALPADALNEKLAGRLSELRLQSETCQGSLGERLADLELFDRRFAGFSSRLHHEVLDCRMRPFGDATQGLRRMVRDVARSLDKNVRFEVKGESTPVDRDILEQLKAPLDHLIRNSLDHGLETPALRRQSDKPEEGVVELDARHSAGQLLITVSDDGRGVDLEAVREASVRRRLTTLTTAQQMSDSEVLEFLFLPGFTLKESVSEISGRGVGLDVVQTMVKEVGGRVRIFSQPGQGMRFQLELPLTLSVIRTLLVEIGGEPFAVPLSRVEKALKISPDQIASLQGRRHFTLGEDQIGLVAAHQVLDLDEAPRPPGELSVVVLGDKTARYGFVIDRFLGEQELVVRTLDPRLGKVRNVSSAALMPDGSPVLIIDVDDLKRSIEKLVSGETLAWFNPGAAAEAAMKCKRVLIVDDSLTVRELERKLLEGGGYSVDVAVDGMDGWNAVRTGNYDLVVTDVDMPRMDGIELIRLIRKDNRLKSLPMMIVSYKDRQEDRTRGLEAGADYYLTKASFHDETLLRVVSDLIGGAEA